MSASKIKAGEAFWEATVKDKTSTGLARAMGRIKAFAAAVKSTQLGDMFKNMGSTFAKVGAIMAAAGGGIVAAMAKSVSVFLEVSKHAKSIGKSIAGIDPSKFEKLNAAFNTARAVLGAIQFFVGSALAEPLTRVLHVLIGVGIQIAKFIRNNAQLVLTVAAVGVGLLAAGSALMAMGAVLGTVGAMIAGVAAGLAALATPAGMVLGVVLGIAAAAFAGVAAWAAFNQAGNNAVTGIAAALANGDIEGSFGIVIQSLATMWAQFSEGVVKVWTFAARAIISAWKAAVETIASGFLEIANMGNGFVGRAMGMDVKGIQAQRDKLNARARGMGLAETGGVMEGAKGSLGEIVAGMAAPIDEFIAAMDMAAGGARKAAEADLKGLADAKKEELKLSLKGAEQFAMNVGRTDMLGSSSGTFSGRGASMMGLGSGGGQKVDDDTTHKLLDRVIKAINGIQVGVVVE
jgi:hypothetical protein